MSVEEETTQSIINWQWYFQLDKERKNCLMEFYVATETLYCSQLLAFHLIDLFSITQIGRVEEILKTWIKQKINREVDDCQFVQGTPWLTRWE